MNISDLELRAMVRDAIARHTGKQPEAAMAALDDCRVHSSHARLLLLSGGDGDGACLIEPSVRCTHCGYCQSYGH